MRVLNFVVPQMYHRLVTRIDGRTHRERVPGDATYTHQLRAFAAAVRGEPTNLTPPEDSVISMQLIDDVYRAAGLHPRGASIA
jgi:predicted dehydrogenase